MGPFELLIVLSHSTKLSWPPQAKGTALGPLQAKGQRCNLNSAITTWKKSSHVLCIARQGVIKNKAQSKVFC